MEDKKALLIDGDNDFLEELRTTVEGLEFKGTIVNRGRTAIDLFKENDFDLVIMDFNLPDMDGLILCREFRRMSSVPIIVVTTNKADIDKVLALDSGADDYMVKPFNLMELKSRIKAIFRRIDLSTESEREETFELGDFVINKIGRSIELSGSKINLTGKEFDIFYTLINNPGRVFSREEILEIVWGDNYFGDGRTVDVHIRRIRRKLAAVRRNREYILTKWGVGYYFSPIEYK